MFKEIQPKLEALGLKPATIRTIGCTYRALEKHLGHPINKGDDLDVSKVTEYINKQLNPNVANVRMYHIQCLSKCFNCTAEMVTTIQNLSRECKLKNQKHEKKPNDKQLELVTKVTWEDLHDLRDTFKPAFDKAISSQKLSMNSVKYILMCFILEVPVLRGQELATLHWDSSFANYVDLATGTVHIREAKTSKHMPHRVGQLPKSLIDRLHLWRGVSPTAVLPMRDGSEMTPNALNKMVVRTCGAGVQYFRKLYVSRNLDKIADVDKRNEIAEFMGHGRTTQADIYNGFAPSRNEYYEENQQLKARISQLEQENAKIAKLEEEKAQLLNLVQQMSATLATLSK